MSKMNVPIARTNLTETEILSALEPLKTGWLVQGPKVKQFEDRWSEFTGAKNSIAVTSCTSALHLSLAALGFGPGDEAIVPAFTWVATANVVEHLGGRVVFADIDLETFNLDVSKLEEKITSKTKAILPVHLFGLSADIKPILNLAKKYGLWVLEDAACGFGSRYHGQHVGTFGDVGCFSFHPRKAITTGEGGMITTNNDALAESLRRLRDHGAAISDLQRHLGAQPYLLADHPDAGYNQRMTDMQAALGSSQMNRASAIIAERQSIAAQYNREFSSLEWLSTPANIENYEHGYQSYPCLFRPEEVKKAAKMADGGQINEIKSDRNRWMNQLLSFGISTRPATHAVHMLSFYAKKYQLKPEDFPNAWAANDCSISLPLFHGMKENEIEHVIQAVKDRVKQ